MVALAAAEPARTVGQWIVFWLVVGLVLLPVIPLLVTWSRGRRIGWGTGRGRSLAVASWLILILSLALLVVELALPEAIGDHYSTRRSAVVYANGGADIIAAILAGLSGSPVRAPAIAAGVLLALSWLYVAVIGSVV